MEKSNQVHSEWSSRFAFILAATGSAVGLGNIWKFPYITGENGGGAFVLVYLVCIVLIGIPIMMAETLLGRRGRQSPINTMKALAAEAGADSRWRWLGWMGVIAGFLILSYYSVIAGWAASYILKALTGSFSGGSPEEIKALFQGLTDSPIQLTFWHTLFIAATMLIVARGVRGGLEKAVRFMVPALLLLLLLLLGYAMTTDAYQQGLTFLFSPDFSRLTPSGILTAMGHAFFTLSLGMGAIMVYGSYLPDHVSVAKTTLMIAGADTVVALLAGMAIFPIVFANGLEPSAGAGLIFQTLPIAFGQMTGGAIFGTLFFVMLFFAALSSSISLIEPAVAWLVENRRMGRHTACLWSGAATWLLGLGTVFSFNLWENATLFGKTFFDLIDYLTANLMLPLGGLLLALFAGWVMKQPASQDELELDGATIYKIWLVLVRYVAPIAVTIVLIHELFFA